MTNAGKRQVTYILENAIVPNNYLAEVKLANYVN